LNIKKLPLAYRAPDLLPTPFEPLNSMGHFLQRLHHSAVNQLYINSHPWRKKFLGDDSRGGLGDEDISWGYRPHKSYHIKSL
jgi:hypothetical protein